MGWGAGVRECRAAREGRGEGEGRVAEGGRGKGEGRVAEGGGTWLKGGRRRGGGRLVRATASGSDPAAVTAPPRQSHRSFAGSCRRAG